MSLFKVSFFVISLHLGLLYWATIHFSNPPVPQKIHLIAQTIDLKENLFEDTSKAEIVKTKPKESKPKTLEEKPKVKEPDKPKEIKEKPPEPPKKAVKKIDPAKINKAKESIAKISKTSDKTNSQAISKEEQVEKAEKIANISQNLGAKVSEVGYREELSNRLRLLLKLPHFGRVEVRLTIDRKGLVKGIEVVSSENDMNQKYVEEELRNFVFPQFGNNFKGETEHTFLISLNNEM